MGKTSRTWGLIFNWNCSGKVLQWVPSYCRIYYNDGAWKFFYSLHEHLEISQPIQDKLRELPISSQTLHNKGEWEFHFRVEKNKNMQHYLQGPFQINFDWLFSNLLHAIHFRVQSNAGDKGGVEKFPLQDLIHPKSHLHMCDGWQWKWWSRTSWPFSSRSLMHRDVY